MKLTLDQVEALAPDAGTLTRAKKIAKSKNYANVGASERAIWAQASGSSTYECFVDMQGPAYKCSCPVHKQPCKHIMGLMLVVALEPHIISPIEAPAELTAWLAKRDGAAQAKLTKQSGEVKDPKAQAKRAEQRDSNVERGLTELRAFLEDTLRMGLAQSSKRTHDAWDQMQRRLMDAQAKGLSGYLEWIRLEMGRGSNWTSRVLRALLRMHTLISAYQNREQLSSEWVDDLRERIGWSKNKDQLLLQTPVRGEWLVLNHATQYESGLYTQTVWLLHKSRGEFGLVLNFATDFNRQSLQGGYQAGSLVNGDGYYYSARAPMRLLLERPSAFAYQSVTDWRWLSTWAMPSICEAIIQLQHQRQQNPLQDTWPLCIQNLRLVTKETQLALCDAKGCLLLLDPEFEQKWSLLAYMGTAQATVFMTTQDAVSVQPWGLLVNNQWLAINRNKLDGAGD